MKHLCLWLALAASLVVSAMAHAVEPNEVLADPALESRARAISRELRCLVCQNQSIDDSSADLARDLRHLVRERLVAGDSDRQVIAFIVERYGTFVRLRPPIAPFTYALWFGPPALLVTALFFVLRAARRRRPAPRPLDADERQRVEALRNEPR